MKLFTRIIAIIVICLAIIASLGFFTLKRGINISELSLSDTRISNAHLIWNNKLDLSVENISVHKASKKPAGSKSSEDNADGAQAAYVRDALHAVNLIKKWFTSIDIKQIDVGAISANFQYRENENGKLVVSWPKGALQSQISTEGKFLLVDIEQASSTEYKSHANGLIRINTQEMKLSATFEGVLADTLPLHLEVKADTDQLSFSGQGKEAVSSIAPIVDLFNLGPDITPWITDNLSASQISLSSVSGTIPYDNPASILQSLHAVAKVKDTEYTFAQGLEPIKAAVTEVEFINGVLKITPENASFYSCSFNFVV